MPLKAKPFGGKPASCLLILVALVVAAMTVLLCGCSAQSEGKDPTAVQFSLAPGIYQDDLVSVELSSGIDGEIYYTLDGSEPTQESSHYDAPIALTDRTPEPSIVFSSSAIDDMVIMDGAVIDDPTLPKANVLRAVCVADDGSVGPIATGTYFVGIDSAELYGDVPIISIVTDPANLLDYDTGILVGGRIYDEWLKTEDAESILADSTQWEKIQGNYSQKGKDWERAASVEFLDNGSEACAFDGGIRVKGGFSRIYGQKSWNVYLRDTYGQEQLDYPLIDTAFDGDGKLIDSYDSFVLRNGGNDTGRTKFKDTFIQSLVADRAFSTQAAVPAVVFLNGEYAGPYSLQERINDEFYAHHYGVDPANVVVIKEGEVEEGEDEDIELFEQLRTYENVDLSDPTQWERFKAEVDIESMVDYYATEIYIGNYDWSFWVNNMLWRTRDASGESPYADGKWRWSLYDTESSSGLYGASVFLCDYDSFAKALEGDALFKSALRNEEFRNLFLDRIKEIGSVNYAPERVDATLDVYDAQWAFLMDDSYKRYGDTSSKRETCLQRTSDYFAKRYDYIIGYVESGLKDFEQS